MIIQDELTYLLNKIKPIKYLTRGLIKKNGRNNHGKITVRHRGGGHKRSYKFINLKRRDRNGLVISLEYDPNRTPYIVRILNLNNFNYYYLLCTQNLEFLDFTNS